MNIIHLGDESTETYFVADYLLNLGHCVSVVGHGPSMEPMIPTGTRMVIQPDKDVNHISPGDAVFNVFGRWGYNVHKVAKMKRKRSGMEYFITTFDGKEEFGWITKERLLGKYIGKMENGKFLRA